MNKRQGNASHIPLARCAVAALSVSLCLSLSPLSWAEELPADSAALTVEEGESVASDEATTDIETPERGIDADSDGTEAEGEAQTEETAESAEASETKEGDETEEQAEAEEELTAAATDELAIVEDLGGVYEIYSASSGKAMDIQSGKYRVVGTPIQQFVGNGTIAQRWYLKPSGSHYLITNGNSGLVIDMGGASTKSGTQVKLAKQTDAASQLWDLYVNGQGNYEIVSVANGMALDVKGGSMDNRAAIQVYRRNHTAAQQWKLEGIAPAVADGVYSVQSPVDNKFVLDVSGGSMGNGAKAQLWTSNGTMAQKWQFTYDEKTGYYSIVSVNSGKVLDIPNGTAASGVVLQQWRGNNTAAQRWKVEEDETTGGITIKSAVGGYAIGAADATPKKGTCAQLQNYTGAMSQSWYITSEYLVTNGLYTISPRMDESKVLDVSGASLAATAKIQLYGKNDTLAQKWVIANRSDDGVTIQNANSGLFLSDNNGTLTGASRVSTSAVWYPRASTCEYRGLVFVNAKTKRVLDVSGGKMTSGNKIQVHGNNNTGAQVWSINATQPIDEGTYTFINCGTTSAQMVMDVKSGSKDNKAAVQLYKSNDSDAQKWVVERTSDGYYTFTCAGSDKVLDIPDGKAAEGKAIQQYRSNGTNAQKWSIDISPAGGLRITSRVGGYDLSTKNSATSNGTPLVLRTPAGEKTQAWRAKSAVVNVASADVDVSASYQAQMIQRANAAKNGTFNRQGWATLSAAQQKEVRKKGSATDWYITVDKGSPNVLNTQVCVLHYNTNGWQVVRSYKARTAANTFTGYFVGYYKREAWWLPVSSNMGVNPWWFCYIDASEGVTGQGFHGGYHSGGCVVIEGINGGSSFPASKWIYDNVPIGTTIDLF